MSHPLSIELIEKTRNIFKANFILCALLVNLPKNMQLLKLFFDSLKMILPDCGKVNLL